MLNTLIYNILPRIYNEIKVLERALLKMRETLQLITHDLKAREHGETVKDEGKEGGAGNNNSAEVKVSGSQEGTGSVPGEPDIRHQKYGEVSYTGQEKKGQTGS